MSVGKSKDQASGTARGANAGALGVLWQVTSIPEAWRSVPVLPPGRKVSLG
eukprot:gene532-759_t